jgi:mannose-6-phosphate isomerase-like protein (cupin superfamily)
LVATNQPASKTAANEKERPMAYTGQVIENPLSEERITFRKTAADTNGELLAIDLELSPDGHVPGMHVHPIQEERFEVVKGTMCFKIGGKRLIANAGDVVVVPSGVRHKFANWGDEEAHARVEIRPALRMEKLFETAAALAEDGRTTRKGMPKPLDLALLVNEFEQEVQGPFLPVAIQRIALAPLAWLARKRDLGARYAPRPAYA